MAVYAATRRTGNDFLLKGGLIVASQEKEYIVETFPSGSKEICKGSNACPSSGQKDKETEEEDGASPGPFTGE